MSDHQQVRGKLLRNIRSEAGARVLYLGTRFFIPPFVLAHIGMQAYGLYGTFFILVAYIGVSTVGFSSAYIKYVAEFAAGKRYDDANRLLSAGIFITTPIALAVFTVFALCWNAVAGHMHVPPQMASDARFLAFTIVGSFLMCLGLSAFRDALSGLQMINTVQRIWISSFVVESALIFLLVGRGWGLRGMGVAFVARSVIDLGASAVVAYRAVPWLRVSVRLIDRAAVRRLLSFGSVVQINSLLAIFLNTVERVIATPLCGLSAAGLLDISTRLPYMALSVPGAFVGAALPSISDVQGRDASGETKKDLVRHVYLTCTRYMNAISGALLGFIAVVAAPVLAFWLKQVPEGAPVLMIAFSVCSQFHLMTGPGTSMVKGIGKPRMEFHYSVANILALCVTVPLSRMFFGSWTATSVGIGVAAATIVSAVYFISTANRCLQIRGLDFLRHSVFPGVLPYAAAFLSGIPMQLVAVPQGRILLACWLGCRFVVFASILCLLWWMFSASATEKSAVLKRLWWQRQILPAQA
jgi:O-antigen/teichoic acid export membrane protein